MGFAYLLLLKLQFVVRQKKVQFFFRIIKKATVCENHGFYKLWHPNVLVVLFLKVQKYSVHKQGHNNFIMCLDCYILFLMNFLTVSLVTIIIWYPCHQLVESLVAAFIPDCWLFCLAWHKGYNKWFPEKEVEIKTSYLPKWYTCLFKQYSSCIYMESLPCSQTKRFVSRPLKSE